MGSDSGFLRRKLNERRGGGREGRDRGLERCMHPRRRSLEELFMLLEARVQPSQRITGDSLCLAVKSPDLLTAKAAAGRHTRTKLGI